MNRCPCFTHRTAMYGHNVSSTKQPRACAVAAHQYARFYLAASKCYSLLLCPLYEVAAFYRHQCLYAATQMIASKSYSEGLSETKESGKSAERKRAQLLHYVQEQSNAYFVTQRNLT